MATILYFIRHGRTDWNDKRIFMGREIPATLNEEGKRQVRELARFFPAPPPVILHSPLRRAIETRDILSQFWTFRAIEEKDLTEVDFGKWTGKQESEVAATAAFQKYLQDPAHQPPPEGETLSDVQTRVQAVIDKALQLKEESVALLSHMDVIRSALGIFLHMPLKEAFRLHIHTASLSAVIPNGRTPTVLVNWIPPSVVDYFKTPLQSRVKSQ